MDNSSNDPQARSTAHEALVAIDTALRTPGVQEELAKQGAEISTSEVEAAVAAKLTELAGMPVVHAAEAALSAADVAIFQGSPSPEPLATEQFRPAPELEPWAQDPAAKAPDAQASLEDRVAALENSVAQMRDIMLHHGLRGPQ